MIREASRPPQKGGRPPHWACVRVRACTVTLSAPLRDSALPPLTFNVVQAEELAADNPMTWTLLTTEPIGTFDQVLYVLSCYGLRWKIEDFHKCWKSGGTNVEGLKLQSRESLLWAAVVLAFVAQRLMQLRDEVDPEPAGSLSRMYISADFTERQAAAPSSPSVADASGSRISIPERPCSDVLSRLEWQVLWLIVEKGRALPPEVPNRRWAYRTIGRLAGWTDTKHTGKMSVKTFWRGYFTLRERVDAVRLAQLAGIKVQNEL